MTNAFFDFTSTKFPADSALYGASGSAYAQANRNRIISDAIPALTLPIGANPVPILSPQGQPPQNFDMQINFQNGWPAARNSAEGSRWHHSDFKQVAYTYTCGLFESFVYTGNLK